MAGKSSAIASARSTSVQPLRSPAAMAGKSDRRVGLSTSSTRAATEPGRDGREEPPSVSEVCMAESRPLRSPAAMAGKRAAGCRPGPE